MIQKKNNSLSNIVTGVSGAFFSMLLGYWLAGAYVKGNNIVDYLLRLSVIMKAPFGNYFNQYSPIVMIIFLITFEVGFLMYLVCQKNYMPGKEYGTAKWAKPEDVNAQLADLDYSEANPDVVKIVQKSWFGQVKYKYVNTRNRQLSEHIYMTLDTQHTDLNNNIFVIGGSGAGKTFRFVQPNLITQSSSFICTDPKGEILKKSGGFLKAKNYKIRVLNLLNEDGMKKSTRYNPFKYLQSDGDVLKLTTNFMANTKKKDSGSGDQFWEDSAGGLLNSLIYYTWKEGVDINGDGRLDRSFKGVVHLLRKAEFKENPDTLAKMDSELDIIMNQLQEKERKLKEADPSRPEHPAIIYYNQTMRGAADTVRSIIQTLNSRFGALQNEAILDLLSEDEMDLEAIGEEKTAVYCVIPDNDKTFNWLVGLLYSQMFQIMYHQADFVYNGALPVHVTFMLDEFANVALPDDFLSLLSTMRSRNISAIIIVQALAQVKKLFKDGEWENITANCDTTIYLGSNEDAAHKYVSEMLGKATIDKASANISRGKNGSFSKTDDVLGRELLFKDEVRSLSKKKCIMFIRGFDPIIDDKIKTPKLAFWKEYCKLQKKFKFDGRIERYTRKKAHGIIVGKDGSHMVMLYQGNALEAMAKKDDYILNKYNDEKMVAELTEQPIPDKPDTRLYQVNHNQLFALSEEYNYELELQMTNDEIIKYQEAILQDIGSSASNIDDMDMYETSIITVENTDIPDIKQKLYLELRKYKYSAEQIYEMLAITNYIRNVTTAMLIKMFTPDMSAAEIRTCINVFYS